LTMNIIELLTELRERDVQLRAVGDDRLQMRAPQGVVTPELRAALATHKTEILRLLRDAENGNGHADDGVAAPRLAPDEAVASHAQEQIWLVDQMSPGNPAYTMSMSYRLRGDVDVDALRKAIAALVQRHEALRTAFVPGETGPRPVLTDRCSVDLQLMNLGRTNGTAHAPVAETEVRRQVREWLAEPFDLASAPLLRARLWHVADDEALLAIAVHHIACDGSSLGLLERELGALYSGFTRGETEPLPACTFRYSEHAWRQRQRLTERRVEQLVDYWREALQGADTALSLPSDRPRPTVQTFAGATAVCALEGELTRRLWNLSRERNVTLFTLLLAAYEALVHRLSGQKDVLVGIPVSMRDDPEDDTLVGDFVNTLVIRSQAEEDPPFVDHLERTHSRVLDALEHRALPFERLVRELRLERDPSRNPLFQTLFSFAPPRSELRLAGLDVARYDADAGGALVDLSLTVESLDPGSATLEAAGCPSGLRLVAHFNLDLFDASTIERWLGHYARLLEGLVESPTRTLRSLPLLTEQERHQMLVVSNRTEADYPRMASVHTLFEEQVARTPERVAVSCGEESLTYAELEARANQLAAYLRSEGVARGSIVAVSVPRGVETLVAILGVLKSGAAYLPLDPTYPPQRLSFMLEDAEACALLTVASMVGQLESSVATHVLLDEHAERIAAMPATRLELNVHPSDRAVVIYTSGSTGKPKGCQVPHGAIVNLLVSMIREPGLYEDDVVAAVTTISFDISVLEQMGPLAVGAHVVVVPTEIVADGVRLREELERVNATLMQATPTGWRILAQAGWGRCPRLRAWSGGEALPRDMAKELLAQTQEVWNLYGPTETTIWSTVFQVVDPEAPILIGRPIANTRIYILDEELQPTPIGVAGELYIGGDGVTDGYLNRLELTRERFVTLRLIGAERERVYRTGDLARYRADGQIEFLGRIDQQVKVRGFRIELGEIEAAIREHTGVAQAVVSAVRFGPGDERLVGYVVPKPSEVISAAELSEFLAERLPANMIPWRWEVLDALPMTANGKVDRKALPAPMSVASAGAVGRRALDFEPPETETERLIAEVWRELLHVDEVGVHDNFFDLGGHSLLAMQVIFRLQQELGLRLRPVDLSIQSLGQLAVGAERPVRRDTGRHTGRQPVPPGRRGLFGGVVGRFTAKVRDAWK
jgi:amino acid adenylation domain-containing protein